MTELPQNWDLVRLVDVAETALGKMLDRGRPKGYGQVPYLRNINVQWGVVNTDDLLTMELADDERQRFSVLDGDLLVCEGGEIGRAAIWRGGTEYVAYQKALHRIRSNGRLDLRYLRYLLEFYAANGTLARRATGSTIAHLPQEKLRTLPVPLPPADEQARIVEILEDHLSRLDAARATVRESRLRLRRFRQSMLTSVFAAAASASSRYALAIDELATVGTGATPLKARRDYYEGGTIPWITSGELAQGLIDRPGQFITPLALSETNVKLFPPGALLVAMYGEGKTRGTVGELAMAATTNQACAAIVLHDQHPKHRAWVRLALEANYRQMRRLASGGVQPNLNLSLVRQIQIPHVSETIRDQLLDTLAKHDASRLRLDTELILVDAREANLRKALLEAAFSGRLTGRASDMDRVEEMAGV